MAAILSRPQCVKRFVVIYKWILIFFANPCRFMMTSSNGNIFRVTGPLCGEFPVPVNFPHKGQWRGALMFSLICVWINDWVNNREAGDLRRHRGHYDVSVILYVTNILSVHMVGSLGLLGSPVHQQPSYSTYKAGRALFWIRNVFGYLYVSVGRKQMHICISWTLKGLIRCLPDNALDSLTKWYLIFTSCLIKHKK